MKEEKWKKEKKNEKRCWQGRGNVVIWLSCPAREAAQSGPRHWKAEERGWFRKASEKRCWQGKRSVVKLLGCFDEAAAREGKRVNRKDKGKRSKPKRTWKKMLTNGTECGKIIRHHKRGRWAWAAGARQRLAHCKLNNAEKRQKTLRFYLRFESQVLLDNDSLRASSKKAWSEGDLAWW